MGDEQWSAGTMHVSTATTGIATLDDVLGGAFTPHLQLMIARAYWGAGSGGGIEPSVNGSGQPA